MIARIFSPPRNAMQSGKSGRQEHWLLEYIPEERKTKDPLMGWTSSRDMRQQLRLEFETQEEAVEYAKRNGIAYRVMAKPPVRLQKKSYSDNFRWGRTENWTH